MADKSREDGTVTPKGILKKPKQKPKQKSFQWDEMNILATYHPADKTYGHMKIEEPKTPYVFESETGAGASYGATFSAEDLAARLAAASHGTDEEQLPRAVRDPNPIDAAELEHQRQFREKRRQHYNEFLAAKMAQESLDQEESSGDDPELDQAVEEAKKNARLNAGSSRQSRSSAPNNNISK